MKSHGAEYEGMWRGELATSRMPSPGSRATKRARQSLEREDDVDLAEWSMGQDWFDQEFVDNSWLDVGDLGLDASWLESSDVDFGAPWIDFTSTTTSATPFGPPLGEEYDYVEQALSANGSMQEPGRLIKMQTGCIPCLVKKIPCDPRNPACKRAMSTDWNLNFQHDGRDEDASYPTPESLALSVFRPDTTWRRNWRERHSLNYFVHFTAPQLSGFFDSAFWQRTVIQTSYHEPAIMHAITAIGALHEAIMQRAFSDEKRKAQTMEFALHQCNRAISSLTGTKTKQARKTPDNRLALTTCVLFTCFEAMQGRCDSAVNHALQGRRLLQSSAASRDRISSKSAGDDDVEQMRPLVERLEVQATALLDKGKRPETDSSDRVTLLPPVDFIFSLDHAHNTLHTVLNSIMRFMQGFHPTAPRGEIAVTMAEKHHRYAPWFQAWEQAFTAFLGETRESMTNIDIKRAMVLKANHLVGTMLASVDQSAGPLAYDPYETEFKAIVDLSREVLATFSCPPLPTLSGGATGAPYLSFSLWVTDPLWMAISRCRNPSIRQAAFTLLSQNPRQEGIWHAGPQLSNNRHARRAQTQSRSKETAKGRAPPKEPPTANRYDSESEDGNDDEDAGVGIVESEHLVPNGRNTSHSDAQNSTRKLNENTGDPKARHEWVDRRAQIQHWTKRT
ncbi:hypothetical protein LTR91_018273 [Friedmanniomyces endolithicus]|uniref:Transcription factor domain-containing protein n=1 Tax=Friedmanniomyces endolithicus TaxID=329885 RepID=A0AAN6FSJ5_9PEZI|nr:hypothetical protein LTS00_016284 [Friedmanniomyces endolithicus]KAK0274886.1 hypothetical protein LTR35_011307 [Friedmanniomyces endolithicus]KAK0323049.1 hypothetical protein LTR82_005979 [Friedmanniomyces endolithicus]KAK0909995.1 hypothetical protein LTR57_016074 [Friedmanniomyces endolithicus]KAK0962871.1 hypothetical protein LTS01_019581 [Friedmanniomyces endolithicus]